MMRSLTTITMAVALRVAAQQPFDLDPTFRADIESRYVSSALPLPDGSIVLSGQMQFPGDVFHRTMAKLDATGERVTDFYSSGLGSGKLTPWLDRFYVATTQTVRRLLATGYQDPDFIEMNSGPYFQSLQGGDYHVYPDGRILMSGAHSLYDSIRGFEGLYNLIWFSRGGYLDTTKTHRRSNGVIYDFKELAGGRFICSGTQTTYEGEPVSKIFRVEADGTLDPGFYSGVNWGEAYAFAPRNDGRVYAGGRFRRTGYPGDTLRVARFLTDGALDPNFQPPHLSYYDRPNGLDLGPSVIALHEFNNGDLLVLGDFNKANDVFCNGICLLDSMGQLKPQFDECGVGLYYDQGIPYGAAVGYVETNDGMAYIWGAYHGYDDGTTSDPLQRMVTRLHGGALPTASAEQAEAPTDLQVFPNPTHGALTPVVPVGFERCMWSVRDALGRVIAQGSWSGAGQAIDPGCAVPGLYTLVLENRTGKRAAARFLFE